MAKNTQIYYSTKYTLPLMTGLIVGFAFSLLCMPFFDCDLTNNHSISGVGNQVVYSQDIKLRTKRDNKNDNDNQQAEKHNQQQLDDFEPRINLQGKPKKPQKATNKLIRPRYAAVELGIREKLFIGVLVNNQNSLSTLAISINQTVSLFANKLIFFVNNLNIDEKQFYNSIPQGLLVISFNDNHEILKPFHTIKYILDNHINNYDWFMLVGDNTFIRGEKLFEFLNHISITQDLYMGNSVNDLYCSLQSGIIFSNTIIRKLANNMEWCTNNAYSNEATDNIGRCVLHSTNLACTSNANGHNFTHHYDNEFNYDKDIDKLKLKTKFNDSLTVSPVRNHETMLKLQMYFNQVEVDRIKNEIKTIEKEIIDMACYTPEGCHGLTWPLGVPPPFHPSNRYEVIRWDYFNDTHIYLEGDFDVINELTEDYKYDISEVIEFSLNQLNEKIKERYKYKSIINGYKQFDPTRGSTYIIDLKLWDEQAQADIHKRINVMRPLGLIELITMPYVTENSKITIVVTFSLEYDRQQIDAFFLNYEHNALEISEVAEKLNLYIVYVKPGEKLLNETLRNEMEETVKYIKRIINELEKKYSSLSTSISRILQADLVINNYTLYLSENYRQLQAIELLTRKLASDALVFLTPPGIEFQLDFLNRIRLNTIKANQVYFPIAFYQYQPNLIYDKKPYPEEIEIHKNYGYFNIYSYEFVSFYNYDYINTRNTYLEQLQTVSAKNKIKLPKNLNIADYISDLYDLFVHNKTLHIIRATDAALKYRWHLVDNCETRYSMYKNSDSYERCLLQLERGLASRAQLALHLIQLYKDGDEQLQDQQSKIRK